jgi:hypothetical protein
MIGNGGTHIIKNERNFFDMMYLPLSFKFSTLLRITAGTNVD